MACGAYTRFVVHTPMEYKLVRSPRQEGIRRCAPLAFLSGTSNNYIQATTCGVYRSCSLLPGNQILISKYLARRGVVVSEGCMEQRIWMATDYKIVVVPDTGGTQSNSCSLLLSRSVAPPPLSWLHICLSKFGCQATDYK